MSSDYQRRWETRRGGRSVADESRTSYYGVPVVKGPHWNWMIIVYFFLGGISSASYVISCIAELIGGKENEQIERVGRYLALAALIPSPFLLIFDLGRPERFHHMLRVIKLRSPMSVGTWGLSIFGVFTTLSALIQTAQDGFLNRFGLIKRLLLAVPCTITNLLGSVFGFFVGGYTGVLLGITAVPVWAKNHLLLGPLFLSSAMSSASAAINLILALLPGDTEASRKRMERLDTIALSAELGLVLAARANLGPVLGRPIREGHLGRVFHWGVLGTGIFLPLLLQARAVFGGKSSRIKTIIASICTLIGGFCVRYLMVRVGQASAKQPEATFEYTRGDRRQEAGDRRQEAGG